MNDISIKKIKDFLIQEGYFTAEEVREIEKRFYQSEDVLNTKEWIGESEKGIRAVPISKIVSVIIHNAIEGGASDIHIEPGRTDARVRYRVDGILRSSLDLPKYLYQPLVARIKTLANLNLDETCIPQDGRIKFNIDNREVDLRVAILPMLDAEKVVLKIVDTSVGVPTLSELGFSHSHVEIIKKNVEKAQGLFLLTGPTGSGKTTTLYSILNNLNSNEFNITTLEDPVEHYITGINQSQIMPDIGFTFAEGLKSALRQDSSVIMVSETRDQDTAQLIVHSASTGRLIFSTLYTKSALEAIPRLIDMGVDPPLLASNLNLIIAQRLVRKICPNCIREIKLPLSLRNKISHDIAQLPAENLKEFKGKYRFYTGEGCHSCGHTGYLGRMVVAEMFEVGRELSDLITQGSSMDKVRAQLQNQCHVSLIGDGIIKALKGLTTIEDVIRISRENNN